MIAAVAVAHYRLRAERRARVLDRLHPDPAARRLDRRLPLAAKADGGLGLGTVGTSVIFLTAILGVVVFLTITRRDETPARNVAPEELQPHLHMPHPHLPHPHVPDVHLPNVVPPRPARDEG